MPSFSLRCLRLAFFCPILFCPAAALNPRTAVNHYSVRGWHTEDGLPSSRVRAAYQTADGYLWLPTSQGIAQFDGNQFTVHTPETHPGLKMANFYDVKEDADGVLWFASNIGVFRYADGRYEYFGRQHGLPQDYTRIVTPTADGAMAVGTSVGLALIRNGRVELPSPAVFAAANDSTFRCRALLSLPDGSLLIGVRGGLWRWKGDDLTKLSGTQGLPEATYTVFVPEADGRIWIGSSRGLHCLFPDGRVETFGADEGLSALSIEDVRFDRHGNMWVGTTGGLFRRNASGRFELAAYPDAFGTGHIGHIYETRDGSLWISTNSGIYQMRDTPISAIGSNQGLKHTVTTLLEARDGSFLIGVWGDGLYHYENNRFTRLPNIEANQTGTIFALHEHTDGSLWIGSEQGLFRYANGTLENKYLRDQARNWQRRVAAQPDLILPGVAHLISKAIEPDGEGGLWVAADGALYHVRGDEYRIVPGTLRQNVKSVTRTRDGDVWVATHDGAMRRHHGQWTTYRTEDGLPTNWPRLFYEDSVGALWVTTPGFGLVRFKQGAWQTYTTEHGLVSNFVTGILEDDLGFLWIGTSHGLMRLARTAFDELDAGQLTVLSPQTVTRKDGLPDSECGEIGVPNALKTRDGRLLFATNRGVALIDPHGIAVDRRPPQVHIERVRVAGQEAARNGRISFAPGSRDIEFRFTATNLVEPESTRFRSRLAPLDQEWVELGTRRDIRYPRLPPGEYTFYVSAANHHGVWNEDGASLAFTVLPFFYQTVWFRVLGALTLGAAAFGFFRARVKRIQFQAQELARQNAELERRVAERTAELERSYETLRASEYFYQSLVESLPQAIVRKDADSHFTYANSGFAELVGHSHDDIIGKSDFDFYSTTLATKFRADDLRIMATRETMEYESVFEREGQPKRFLHIKKVPLYDQAEKPIGVQVLFWDMTVFRETEEKLKDAQRDLLESSRLAGMAEVATGVLHNIGNALNSVNVSADIARTRIRALKIPSITRVANLLLEQGDRLADFIVNDPRGRQVPEFLNQLGRNLEAERDSGVHELDAVCSAVEHIKEIVAAQQDSSRARGVSEMVPPAELIEYALRINASALSRHNVVITREFFPVPAIRVLRQKALQILVNLITNAKDALADTERSERRLSLSVKMSESGLVQICVADNGRGVAPENLSRIFNFGFTTKKNGHGFGLHTSALAAKEMGGSLRVVSEGVGKGTVFFFELPLSDGSAVEPEPTALAHAAAAPTLAASFPNGC